MGRVSHVVSIADDISHNPYFHDFISGNEKQLIRSAFSSCHTLISVSKIRLCLSAVNGTAQIHQSSEKKAFFFVQKTAPASCFGNRGGSFVLFVLFQALTRSLAGILIAACPAFYKSSVKESSYYRHFFDFCLAFSFSKFQIVISFKNIFIS